MTMRRWVLPWVLFALVCAQALGFMHRVVHAQPAAPGHAVHATVDAGEGQAGWLQALFAHTDENGCRLLDGANQCGAPAPAAAAAFPLSQGTAPLPTPALAPPGARDSPFQARAPPASR